jgi:hypothetical protein
MHRFLNVNFDVIRINAGSGGQVFGNSLPINFATGRPLD